VGSDPCELSPSHGRCSLVRVFERFTDRARKVIVLAQEEARLLKHNYIGTEHLLLGLIRDEDGLAARTLASHGVRLDRARDWVATNIGVGDEEPVSGQLPFTPRMKKIFELSLRDAEALDHHAIGTEHVLIALLHEGQGAALHALRDLGAPPGDVWTSAFRRLGVQAPPYVQSELPKRPERRVPKQIPSTAAVAAGGAFAVGLLVGWLIWG
jgi:ATP-dependent Clp protease ATP-binding subunit ClpA